MKALVSLFIIVAASACATNATVKLPSCAEVGCPATVLCSGTDGTCSCVAAPGDLPVECERNPGVDAGSQK